MTAQESRLYTRLVETYRWLLCARANAEASMCHLHSSNAALVRHTASGRPDAKARDVQSKIAALKEAVEVGLTLSDSFLKLLGPDKPHGLSYRHPWVGEPHQARERPKKDKRHARPRRA
jgi:hypothetical protein